jgi:hypothetical protein
VPVASRRAVKAARKDGRQPFDCASGGLGERLRVLLTGGNGGLASLPLGGLVGGGLSAPLSFAIPSLFADPFLVVVASLIPLCLPTKSTVRTRDAHSVEPVEWPHPRPQQRNNELAARPSSDQLGGYCDIRVLRRGASTPSNAGGAESTRGGDHSVLFG